MAHEQALADACTSQCDVQRLPRNTALRDGIEHVEIEGQLVLGPMIEIVPLQKVGQIVVTDAVIEIDGQRLLQDVWDGDLGEILALSIDDLDRLHDGQIQRTVLAPLFGGRQEPIRLDVNRIGKVRYDRRARCMLALIQLEILRRTELDLN